MGTGESRINEAETVNVLLALRTWQRLLRNALVNIWVDSSTTKGVVTNGYSSSKVLTAMSAEVWYLADRLCCGLWIFRVPTKLNPADPLSRGCRKLALSAGFTEVEPAKMSISKWCL